MARILIISNGPLCRNPRVLKEATALGGAGYDVTVLTFRNHAPSEAVDAELMRHAPFRRETVDTLPAHVGPVTRLWRRGLTWAARGACTRFGLQSIHALGPASALLARAHRLPSDLAIVHNEIPHWIGLRLQADGRRVAADIEDWHSEDLLPAHRAHRPIRLIREVERRLLHEMVFTSTTSEAMASALHARYGGKMPAVLTNSFPLQPQPHVVSPRETPALFWFSQTVGPGRGLEELCAAWGRTRHPSRLVLLGELRPGYDRHLRELLPEAFRPRISFLPLVPPAELPALIARHDIGLATEPAVPPNKDLTISNKILQYLNAGIAVVASDTAGQREVLAHAPGAGALIRLGDPAQFAAQLDTLLGDPGRLAAHGAAARRAAEDLYCWEKESPRLLARVAAALG